MSDEELDPEVIADLRLRAATERDPTRSRKLPDWTPPVVVEQVPCRARCGAVTDWTAEAEDAFATWNRILERRDESPLDKTRIVFCEACRTSGVPLAAERNRKHHDAVGERIRKLKASKNPDGETKLIDELRKLSHPDVDGLLEALRNRNAKTSSGKRAKQSEVTP